MSLRRYTASDYRAVEKLRHQGMTHQAIAKELGLTRQTIGFLIRTGHRLPEVINDMPIRKVVKPMFDKTGEELFQHDRYYSF